MSENKKKISAVDVVFKKKEENERWVFLRAAGRAMHWQSDAAGLGPGPSMVLTRDQCTLSSRATCLGKLLYERVSNVAVIRTGTPVLTLETVLQHSGSSSHPRAWTCCLHQGC